MVFQRFSEDETGAIAPLYALALFGLIGMAGVGFDYARVMAMDTELQNAADQAALAAATQLDGKSDSITRAQAAVTGFFAKSDSVFVNQTRLSTIDDDNDGNTRPISQVGFAFWEDYVDDAPVRPVALNAADSSKAEVVQVTVNQRALQYALTPIVGAIVGQAGGSAMARVTSAYCKVPPLMFCAPNSPTKFDPNSYIGKGIKMHTLPSGSTDANPGIFGFLDFPYTPPPTVNGANLTTSLGWGNENDNCTSEVIEAQPGVVNKQAVAYNTRFNIQTNGLPGCTTSDNSFCSARNVTKDAVRTVTWKNLTSAEADAKTCASTGGTEGTARAYDVDVAPYLTGPPGYPVETCLTGGGCSPNSRIGDGWTTAQYDAYMNLFHTGTSANSVFAGAGVSPAPARTPYRYEVYKWENADLANRVNANQNKMVGLRKVLQSNGKYEATVFCAQPQPTVPSQVQTQGKDRRFLTVAAVDCTNLHGSAEVDILSWVDLFLLTTTEPAGSEKAFYAEIIGEAVPPGASNAFQGYGKKKVVLIR